MGFFTGAVEYKHNKMRRDTSWYGEDNARGWGKWLTQQL